MFTGVGIVCGYSGGKSVLAVAEGLLDSDRHRVRFYTLRHPHHTDAMHVPVDGPSSGAISQWQGVLKPLEEWRK